MNRDVTDELIGVYLDGELPADEAALAERALTADPGRRAAFDEMRALRDTLQLLPQERLEEDFSTSVMERAMRENGALFGGGRSGRFWYRSHEHHYSPDALITLALVLRLLSQSGQPLSTILDAKAALR